MSSADPILPPSIPTFRPARLLVPEAQGPLASSVSIILKYITPSGMPIAAPSHPLTLRLLHPLAAG